MFYPIGFMIYSNSFLNRVLSYWYLALFISMIVSIIAYLLYDSLSVLLALCLMLNSIGLLQLYLIYSLLLYPIGFLLLYSIGSLHILSHWFSPGLSHWLSPSALPHWLSPALSHELFPVRFCLLVPGFVLSLKDCFFYPLLCFLFCRLSPSS